MSVCWVWGPVTRYISGTTGAGIADGSSWANAAPWSALDTQCVAAGAGGNVLIDSKNPINITSSISLSTTVGTSTAPVTISGANPTDNRPAYAKIVGNRQTPFNSFVATTSPGTPALILNGVSNVILDHLSFRHVGGNGAINTSGTTVDNCILRHLRGYNVERFFFATTGHPMTNSVFSDIKIKGFSKACIRFNTSCHGILIEDFYLDGDGQYGDSFAGAITFAGSGGTGNGGVTDPNLPVGHLNGGITIRNGTIKHVADYHTPNVTLTDATLANGHPTLTSPSSNFTTWGTVGMSVSGTGIPSGTSVSSVQSPTSLTMSHNATADINPATLTIDTYWNGDGIAAERADSGFWIENVRCEDISDGGIDIKCSATVIKNCRMKNCKRSFRIWGSDVTLINNVSLHPRMPGGTGGALHLWASDGGCKWYGGVMDSQGWGGTGVENDGTAVLMQDATVIQPTGSTFATGPVTQNNVRHVVSSDQGSSL